jgi:hypothetical protein
MDILTILLVAAATWFIKPVQVAVPVPCKIIMPSKPVMPLQELSEDESDVFVITQNALAEIELRKGYEVKLEAEAKACQGEVK